MEPSTAKRIRIIKRISEMSINLKCYECYVTLHKLFAKWFETQIRKTSSHTRTSFKTIQAKLLQRVEAIYKDN